MPRAVAVLAVLLALAAPQSAAAQAKPDATEQDGPFRGIALITTDPDWMKEWNTDPGHVPHFTVSDTVMLGEAANVLVFFTGARSVDGHFRILCSLSMTRPDGTTREFPPTPCFTSPVPGAGDSMFLTEFQIAVGPERGDARGLYQFVVGLTDAAASRHVDLRVSIESDPTRSR